MKCLKFLHEIFHDHEVIPGQEEHKIGTMPVFDVVDVITPRRGDFGKF
jgi:hypothetical protein